VEAGRHCVRGPGPRRARAGPQGEGQGGGERGRRGAGTPHTPQPSAGRRSVRSLRRGTLGPTAPGRGPADPGGSRHGCAPRQALPAHR
ncbi:hypothetical protein DQE84_15945, partial [Staphylococcus warneri]